MPTLRPPEPPRTPRTWIVVGEKQGDNAQVRAIAAALGWPVEERRVAMRAKWVRGKPRVRASLDHIDPERSDAFEPPWPDLLITIGRRLSMVALWVREQSRGHTRIVLVGKPRRHARRFDLIVASAQYRVGDGRNVLRLGLPLMRVDAGAVAGAAAAWRGRLGSLPRPLTALLVGGPTKPARFDAGVARELGEQVRALLSESGGSLYVTTSRRTTAEVTDTLTAVLPREAVLFRWRPDATDNPYLALLGLADRFVVTSDSVTMMLEVARLGRPLAIFSLPFAHAPFWQWVSRGRDLDAIPRLLIAEGRAVRLGTPFRPASGTPPDELPRVAERIRALFLPQRDAREPVPAPFR
jgi:mitochondrial fission protein ELM1